METEVGVEGNEEGKLEETRFEKCHFSLSSSTKQLSDPVVYKLVRVEGDGRLVPATDDEVMEVEGMLNVEKSETHIVSDTGQAVGYISNEGPSSDMLLEFETLQGLSNSANNEADEEKLNARLKYIEAMLQKVKEEERLRLACGSPDYSSAYVNVDSQCTDQHDKLPNFDEKLQSEIPLQETVPFLSPSMRESHMISGNIVECPNSPEKLTENGSLICSTLTSSQPDFSLLRGEICLDNLSIRELHETFKATFGRETTVKDKQWLKRRIAMGLTNSCDVSTTTLIIKDNKLVKTAKEDCTGEDVAVADDLLMSTTEEIPEEAQVSNGSQLVEEHQVVSDKRNYSLCYYSGSEDNREEQRVAKRLRKPTRRYIEELSEVEDKESSSRPKTSVKDDELVQITSHAHVRAIRNVASDGRTIGTRLDSLGGSGIEIPCVSRVRRSRPRKNLMGLMKFNCSDTGMTATVVKKALDAHAFLSDNENGDKMEARPASPQIQQQVLGLVDKDKQFIEGGNTGPAPDKLAALPDKLVALPDKLVVLPDKPVKHMDSSGDSDDNIATVPTSKGGIRRKHHRAWTLSEVMKLVEGVSRYGAGKWSEIKRLAFASYSYRTSVDLKDKWRNLLKASLAQIPSEKGLNSRKNNATMPIPEPILLRVRELAEMQSVSIPNLSLNKVGGSTGSSVHEKKPGYYS